MKEQNKISNGVNRIIKIIIPILLFVLFFNISNFSYGQNEAGDSEEIREINKQIEAQRARIRKMQDQQVVYESLIR